MKIMHIVNAYSPIGGIETYVLNLLPLLEENGHQNVVVHRDAHSRIPPVTNRAVYYVSSDDEQDDRTVFAKITSDEQPTIAYLHGGCTPSITSEIAQNIPIVAYVHGFTPVCPGLAKYYRIGDTICTLPFGARCVPMILFRRCASARHPQSIYRIMRKTKQYLSVYQSLDHILVASDYMRTLLVQNGFEKKHIDILPPHFEEVHHVKCPQTKPCVILFVGRLEEEKGVPYLLKAMKWIDSDCQLLVLGDGTSRKKLEDLAKSLDLDSRIRFGGWCNQAELHKAYEKATVVVLPSIMPEPFGKVGIEAFAHGRPVVAFDVGGVSDWLKDGENGFLIPPKDVKTLASRIKIILDNANLAARFGSNGRKLVQNHFSPQAHVNNLTALFEMVIYKHHVRKHHNPDL